jgi:FixJ family two-component response regulator
MSRGSNIVLIVDDDAAVRASLKFALEIEGFEVRLYDSAEAVLADADLPDDACFVIDYRMPDIDGIELIDRLRRRNVKLPAILISGRASGQLRTLAEKSDLSAVLEKPLSDSVLAATIRTALAPAC